MPINWKRRQRLGSLSAVAPLTIIAAGLAKQVMPKPDPALLPAKKPPSIEAED